MSSPEKHLYLIGGGTPDDGRMAPHFNRVTNIASERSSGTPKIALLPTAHHNGLRDELRFRSFFSETFRNAGVDVEEILLGDVPLGESENSRDEVADILESSDALFVLNGDTRHMMEVLLRYNLVPVFREHYENGLLLSGSSAGCIWVGDSCMSDSEAFSSPNNWDYIGVEGLGIVHGVINAHDNQDIRPNVKDRMKRNDRFDGMMREHPQATGIAIDEFVALDIRNTTCNVISEDTGAGAYFVTSDGSSVHRRHIKDGADFSSFLSS